MQTLQYENLREKITEARRAKHDVRHHIAVMQEYLNSGDLEALRKYLVEYNASLPDDSLVCFCENIAANAVLLYFAQQAKNHGIDYLVKAVILNDIFISETDLSVLFDNPLENALDACKAQNGEDKKIIVRANLTGESLCITVDNTYAGTLKHTEDGNITSTKHKGPGLGTQSVKSIVQKYGGVCRFETENGMFYASILCNEKP